MKANEAQQIEKIANKYGVSATLNTLQNYIIEKAHTAETLEESQLWDQMNGPIHKALLLSAANEAILNTK